VLWPVGGGEHEDLATCFDAVEQDEELGDGGNLVLGALGGARGGDGVYFVEQNDGWGEFLRAFEDGPEGGLGLANPLPRKQQSRI
jgi:hypothetical protein